MHSTPPTWLALVCLGTGPLTATGVDNARRAGQAE